MSTPAIAPSPWRVFSLVGGTMLLGTVNFSLVFVAFATLADSFGVPETTFSWALTGFTITLAAGIVPAGWLADRYGRKHTMLVGLAVFTIGSTVVAVSPTVEWLIAGRVVQAAGLALESSASLAIVLNAFPANRRSTAVGGLGALGGAAAAVGPVVGGALVEAIGWRWTFFLNVPFGVVLLILLAARLPSHTPEPREGTPDVIGALSLMVGVGSLALAVVQLEEWGVTDPRLLASLAIGFVVIVAMVLRSARIADPILHLPLYRIPSFRIGSLLNLVVAGSFAGMYFSYVTLLTEGWDLNLRNAGLALGIIPALGGPLSFLAGRIADTYGSRAVIVPGTVLLFVAGVMTHWLIGPEPAIWSRWVPTAVVFGTGVGFAHAASHSAAMRHVPPDRLGIGGAMSRIMMDVGSTISVAVAVAVVASADDTVAGINRAAYLLMGVAVVGFFAALRLRPTAAA